MAMTKIPAIRTGNAGHLSMSAMEQIQAAG
jgi:hypothetical protein